MKETLENHVCEMAIYIGYETYAMCSKCGRHDWSHPSDWKGESLIPYFKEKYPESSVVDLTSGKDPDNTHCDSDNCYGKEGDLCDCKCLGCEKAKEMGI